MAKTVDVDTKNLQKGITKLLKDVETGGRILFEMELIANEVLNRAIESPVPRDTSDLERSATTVIDKSKKEVVFGFNKVYAAFQDAPGRTAPYIIRPVRKKALFIPLTKRARLHRAGNDPAREGLQRDVDFVIRKQVTIPIKPYGSELGPNHYFSETLKRNVNFILESLATRIGRLMEKEQKK